GTGVVAAPVVEAHGAGEEGLLDLHRGGQRGGGVGDRHGDRGGAALVAVGGADLRAVAARQHVGEGGHAVLVGARLPGPHCGGVVVGGAERDRCPRDGRVAHGGGGGDRHGPALHGEGGSDPAARSTQEVDGGRGARREPSLG